MKQKIKKDIFTYEDILHAYMGCRKHKRNSKTANDFETNFVNKLRVLLGQINRGDFKPGRYKCFPVLKPKLREIWAAPFKDRIVHHIIYNELHTHFEKHYIDQTYSCIKGRGTTKCINDVFKGCRSITNNFQKEGFFIKIDIKSFFVSIDKEILFNLIKEKVDDCLLLDLIKKVLFHDITKNPKITKAGILRKVPTHKSLFYTDYNIRGLPIGNLTSQFFSNIYLNGLDQYCKHNLKLKYYYRYADDIIILIKDSSIANDIVLKINEWLLKNRNLTLNMTKTVINRIRLGIKFLGSRFYYYYKIPSKRIFTEIKKTAKNFGKNCFDCKEFATANSYLGLGSTYNIHSFCARILDKNRLNLIYNNDAKRFFYL